MSRVQRIAALRRPHHQRIGNKASTLARLSRAGFAVPDGFVIPTKEFDSFVRRALHPNDWPSSLLTDRTWNEKRFARVRSSMQEVELPVSLRHDLRKALLEMRRDRVSSFVVRSSSPAEDRAEASGAGLFLSILDLRDDDAVFSAVKEVWASLYSQAALGHFATLPDGTPSLAVLVQRMVHATVHGVVFSVNPLSGDPSEIVVDASRGGATNDAEIITPDTIRIDRATGRVRDAVRGQQEESEGDPELALNASQLSALHTLVLDLESQLGEPQDIEWAFSEGELVVLQSRPVTRLGLAEGASSPDTVWTNANVAEALPGVVTPLTWSVMRRFSEHGFSTVFRTLGCRFSAEQKFVGNFRGRIYLNFSAIMDVLAQIPGLKPDMLHAIGGGPSEEPSPTEAGRITDRVRFALRFPLTAVQMTRALWRAVRRDRHLRDARATEIARLDELDLRVLSASGLDQVLWDAERLLRDCGEQLLRVMGLLLAIVGGGRVADSYVSRKDRPTWMSDIATSVVVELESAKPAIEFDRVVDTFRADEIAKQYLANTESPVLAAIPDGDGRAVLAHYLKRFGHRAHREAELCEPRWRESPDALLRLLKGRLEQAPRMRVNRTDLRPRVSERVKATTGTWVARYSDLIRARESLRSDVVRILGVLRTVALEAENRMRAREPELMQDAAFFLDISELHEVLSGKRAHVSPLVAFRHKLFLREQALPDPPPQFVGRPPPDKPPEAMGAELRGLAVSPGLVRGRAAVVQTHLEAAALAPDEIAILRVADVSWMPFLSQCRGVITELGGPLSHAGVVLRELGVPAVFNVPSATKAIATGAAIALDGDRGVIYKRQPSVTED